MSKHKLHTHPKYEQRLGLPNSECIVDIEFISKFSGCKRIPNDSTHIIVLREEFLYNTIPNYKR